MSIFAFLLLFATSLSFAASLPQEFDSELCIDAMVAAAQHPVELSTKKSILKIIENTQAVDLSEVDSLISRVKKVEMPPGGELNPYAAFVEIIKLKEVQNTYIALFNKQKFMNLALDRATTFIESSNKITSQYEMLHGKRRREIAGHDLKGKDLIRFRDEYEIRRPRMLQARAATDQAYLQIEEDFWQNFLLSRLKKEPNLILIASSAIDEAPSDISHEILHAVFFRHRKYKQAIADFWETQISDPDKTEIRRILSSDYDEDDVVLMENEFQAYILEKDAGDYELHKFVRKYHRALIQWLESRGFNFETMNFTPNSSKPWPRP